MTKESQARNMIALDATLVSHAEPKKFEVLLVDDVSRLSRDQIEIERLRRKFMCWGIRLIGISDGIDGYLQRTQTTNGSARLIDELYLEDLKE